MSWLYTIIELVHPADYILAIKPWPDPMLFYGQTLI